MISTYTTRILRLIEKQKKDFQLLAEDNGVVRRAVGMAYSLGLPDEIAWLWVALHLVQENKALMENAQVLLNTRTPTITFRPEEGVNLDDLIGKTVVVTTQSKDQSK